jgi:hypothetical protein
MLAFISPCKLLAQSLEYKDLTKNITSNYLMKNFINICGGIYYAACDGAEYDQNLILTHAINLGKEENKTIIITFGSDNIQICKEQAELFDSEEGVDFFNKNRAINVRINTNTVSGIELFEFFRNGGVMKEKEHAPFIFAINPKTGKARAIIPIDDPQNSSGEKHYDSTNYYKSFVYVSGLIIGSSF